MSWIILIDVAARVLFLLFGCTAIAVLVDALSEAPRTVRHLLRMRAEARRGLSLARRKRR